MFLAPLSTRQQRHVVLAHGGREHLRFGLRCRSRPHVLPRATPNSNDGPPNAEQEGTVVLRAEKPIVLPILMIANLGVYAAGIAIALLVDGESSNEFFFLLAKVNDKVADGEWWRLLSATFMHAGLLHIATNTVALWYIGLEAEAIYGYSFFLAIYLLSGATGNVASYMLDDLVTVGASGAIFGLLGALAAYFLRNPRLERSRLQLLFLFSLVSLNIALGTVQGSLVDNSGHVAGFVSGLWLGWNTCPVWRVDAAAVKRPVGAVTTPAAADIRGPPTTPPIPPSTATGRLDEQLAFQRADGSDSGAGEALTASSATRMDATAAGTADPTASQKTIDLLSALVPEAEPERQEQSTSQANSATSAAEQQPAQAAAESREGETRSTVPVQDVSRTAVGLSVMLSFAASLGVLTWAGTLARVAERGMM